MRGMPIYREIAISFARTSARSRTIKSRGDFSGTPIAGDRLFQYRGLTLTRSAATAFSRGFESARAATGRTGRFHRVNRSARVLINPFEVRTGPIAEGPRADLARADRPRRIGTYM